MDSGPNLPETTDVVVIGGGIMGTSTTFFLASETDLDITLIEKGNIASGSTGDSSAILRHHYGPQERYSRMAWWSHQFYQSFEENTGQRIAYAENPLVRFAEEGTVAAEYAMDGYDVLSELDIPVSRYETPDLDNLFPMLELRKFDFDFGVSDDSAGYSDGTDAANGFARAAQDRGATIVTGVSVEDIIVEDGAINGVATNTGNVACETVVLTAGPWTPNLAATVGLEVPILVEREQILILDPSEDYTSKYPDLTPTTALPGGEWYIRPDFGDGVLVATHHTGEEVNPDSYDNQVDEEMLLELTEQLGEIVPNLADAGIQGQYCGIYSTTPDHDFIIDQAGPDGCYLACGFSGHGFKHGPAIGRIMTDLITTGTTELVDSNYFSLDRFEEHPDGHGLPEDYA